MQVRHVPPPLHEPCPTIPHSGEMGGADEGSLAIAGKQIPVLARLRCFTFWFHMVQRFQLRLPFALVQKTAYFLFTYRDH